MDAIAIKRRFGVIGVSPALDRAVTVASQVAPTDLSVLVLGESGVGKEIMPRVVHQFSKRKHGAFIAVNCGAIPEGTRFRKAPLILNFSGMKKERLRVLRNREKDILKRQMAEPFSSTRLPNCP